MRNTGSIVAVVLIVLLAVLLLGGMGMMGLGGYGMMGPGMMGGYGGYGGYGGMMGGFGAQGFAYNPLGAILSLVFWAFIIIGIILLAVWLVRNAGRTGLSAPPSDLALDVLRARYAKGEITKEQFEEMRRTLAQ